uniref:Transmembrane protein 254 n=1 Tax=Dicentrarchus labrax TaxID=13489 RepID=A0A8C4GMS8_DICLA
TSGSLPESRLKTVHANQPEFPLLSRELYVGFLQHKQSFDLKVILGLKKFTEGFLLSLSTCVCVYVDLLCVLQCTVFAPEVIPFQHLGPFGTFCRYLVDNYADIMYKGWWAAWIIHAFEAFVALRMCTDKGISSASTRCMWFGQTFLFGFASLGLLLKYDPERPKQH